MKTQARVVVIGGGAIGVSVAYHLAKYGWKDVVLIEKHELTSGSTWMAAGNCSFFHGNYYCTQVNMKSIEIYQQLEAETGQSVGWHTTGSIRTADNPGRMEELGYTYSMNRCLGLDVDWMTPEKMKEMHPLMNTDGIIGGLYWPDDGDVDPNGITMAMSIGAKKQGAEINTHTQVTGIDRTASGEWLVHTDKGDITCEYVVNAAGLWAPEVAKMVGLEIPSIAGEHTHILFEAIDAVEKRDAYLPLVRDPDRSIYIRQEMDSLILGLYESKVKQWNPKGVPWDYAQTELQPDIDHIADFIENGIYRFPDHGRDRLQARHRRPHHLYAQRRPPGGTGLPAEKLLPCLRVQLRHHPGRRHRPLPGRLDDERRARDRPVAGGQPPLRQLCQLGLQP
jgi:dimethylglycine dehydrogenase